MKIIGRVYCSGNRRTFTVAIRPAVELRKIFRKKKKRLRKLTSFERRTVGVPDQTHYHYTTVAIAADVPIFHDYIDAANNIITIGAIIYPCPSPHPLPCPKPMP